MNRAGEQLRIAGEDGGGAVALMHVAIKNQHPLYQPAGAQRPGGDRQIIKNAEAGAEVIVGVVGAAGQVAGNAVLQRQLGGEQSAHGRDAGAPDQVFTPGQAHAFGFPLAESVAEKAVEILRAVRQRQQRRTRPPRTVQIGRAGDAAVAQPFVQQPELFHRKAVPAGKRKTVGRMIDKRYGHGGSIAERRRLAGAPQGASGKPAKPWPRTRYRVTLASSSL